MSPVKKNDAEQERLAVLEEIGIKEKALVYDEDGDKLLLSDDAAVIKDFYARAFQNGLSEMWREQPRKFSTPSPFL